MTTCATCRHFHAAPTIDLSAQAPHGECRRYPATRNDIVTPSGLGQLSGWPTVKRSMGCGEWAPALAAVS